MSAKKDIFSREAYQYIEKRLLEGKSKRDLMPYFEKELSKEIPFRSLDTSAGAT